MKIFEAARALAKLTTQFKAAGLNIDDFIAAADETALQAHLETLRGDPEALKAALTRATAAEAAHATLTQGLSAAGITLKCADETKALQASDVSTAIDARVSLKAGELAATLGVRPVETEVKPSAAAPKKNEKPLAEFFKLSDHARCQFIRTGGKLTD